MNALTTEQTAALKLAAQPLIDFMAANFHPHCKVIVDSDSAELVEGLAMVKTENSES